MTIPDPVRRWATRQPEAPALITPSIAWTWSDLDARVGACARQLKGGPYERVGVCAKTQPDLVVLVLAALRASRVLVPLSPRWPRSLLIRAMERLELASLVTDGEEIEGIDVVALQTLTQPDGSRSDTEDLHTDAPFTIVHTSGSTGDPKAALHTVGNHVESAHGLMQRFPLGPGDRWLLNLPLDHVGGLAVVMRCALAGATMVLPELGMATAEAIAALRPTRASLVSTQLVRLLRDDIELTSLRLVLLGGSAFPPSLLDAAVARGLPVAMGYGMTEMTSTVTSSSLPAERGPLSTSGTVLPGRELRVSVAGEIEVRGPTLFVGYVDGDHVQRPEVSDGWFATGDRGEIDADGRLMVYGRIGNGFVSGGENIQPEAIEAALAAHPHVTDAIVVPVPDTEFGARPVAYVQMAENHQLDVAELAFALRASLPGFMVPIAFLPWNEPTSLKPNRHALAQDATTTLGLDEATEKGHEE